MRRLLRVMIVALASAAACGGQPQRAPMPDSAHRPISSAAPQAPAPKAAATQPAAPDTPAGKQLAWVLSALVTPPTEADAAPHFAPSFLEKVPASKLVAVFAQMDAELAPLTLVRLEGVPTTTSLVARVRSAKGPELRVSLATEAAEPYRMVGLLLRPAVDLPTVSIGSWEDAAKSVREVAPQSSWLAAGIGPTGCTKIAGENEDTPRAIGSAFKLYILSALAKDVAAKKRAWTEKVAIEDAKKSLPSGDMRNEPAGKTFTVREMAEKMISVSDNTATDHLLFLAGREAVEAAVKASGHAKPELLVPFLSTREMFAFKLLATDDEQRAYLAADVAKKRAMLDAFAKKDLSPAMSAAAAWTSPRFVDEVEWRASPNDLCKLMVELHGYGAPVSEILSINPGIPDETHAFEYVGFKGGSEPGVLELTWLLRRASDHEWLFLATAWNDTRAPIEETKAIGTAAAVRAFLASH